MRVALGSMTVTDDGRRAIRARVGKSGLATRKEVRDFIVQHGGATLDDVTWEWQQEESERPRLTRARERKSR